MTKIKMIVAAIAVAGTSTMAFAAEPPDVPQGYETGPASPSQNTTNMSEHERIAFAMLEGLLQMTEGRIHADGCDAMTLPIEIWADDDGDNYAKMGSFGNNVEMTATAGNLDYRGQKVKVEQDPVDGHIAVTEVSDFESTMKYNAAGNMMVGDMSVNIKGLLTPNESKFVGSVIKDFAMGGGETTNDGGGKPSTKYYVYDWGLQSLSKLGYPVEKYWQRSKVKRKNGGDGRTVFVKDRLVGNTECRITINLYGDNFVDSFWMTGDLTVAKVDPSEAVGEFTENF